jgi:DUF971 family protein
MTPVQPVELQKTRNRELFIRWSDGLEQTIPFRRLRDACQCAKCIEKRNESKVSKPGLLPVLTPAETLPLEILKMEPVGNYAYSIHFSDGHSSGIFSLELLRAIR